MRTSDTSYGDDYWNTLDGGAGYQDSTMWEDIAHAIKEVAVIDRHTAEDRSGQTHAVDVGCANGYLVKHLRRRGLDCWGLDFSEYALEHADPDAATYLRWFDLCADDMSFFGKECFDLVTCFETLEHLPAACAERALGHLYKLLRPGGLLIATICVEGQPGADDDPTHVNVVPRAWWERQFRIGAWLKEPEMEQALCWFWLFSAHRGVFVRRRPPRLG